MKNIEDNWIPIYNAMFDSRDATNYFHLSPDEVMMYILISKNKTMMSYSTEISYSQLLDFFKMKSRTDTKKKMAETMHELNNKNILTILEENSNGFVVQIHNEMLANLEGTILLKGYHMLTALELDMLLETTQHNSKLIYAYLLIRARGNMYGTLKMPYDVLSQVIGLSRNTVMKIMHELEELGLITITTYKIEPTKNVVNQYTLVKNVASGESLNPLQDKENRLLEELYKLKLPEDTEQEDVFLQHQGATSSWSKPKNTDKKAIEDMVNNIF